MSKSLSIYLLLLLYVFLTACGNADLKEPLEYTGPLSEGENVEVYYSEKDKVKIKMSAALAYEFKNGDQEYPKGIYMEFYDETGKLESILKANHAYFFKEENKWRGRDNVEIKNLKKNEQLNTEELFWSPAEKKIFTDKFVTIKQEQDIIYGEGLEANEDLSGYEITRISGEMEIDE